MARKKQRTDTLTLIDALKFISLAQHEKGSPLKTYCQLSDGFATSSDGILTASHKIEEDLEARPHTTKLIAALTNCGKNLSITQLENNVLAIRSGKYFAHVPCHDDEISKFVPDQPVCPISNSIKEGFAHIGHLSQEAAATVYQSSILLRSGSMISTNGIACLEYWHGIDLPTIVVPKSFVSAICKINKPLVNLGFSQSSVTFWFDDESWLKTQLFADPWPDIDQALNMAELSIIKRPLVFYKALRAVEDFVEDGREKGVVYLSEYGISSHLNRTEGACYDMKNLGEIALSIRQLKNIETSCDQIAFDKHRLFFFGDKVRGVLMGVVG
jgi:hypothetical protein